MTSIADMGSELCNAGFNIRPQKVDHKCGGRTIKCDGIDYECYNPKTGGTHGYLENLSSGQIQDLKTRLDCKCPVISDEDRAGFSFGAWWRRRMTSIADMGSELCNAGFDIRPQKVDHECGGMTIKCDGADYECYNSRTGGTHGYLKNLQALQDKTQEGDRSGLSGNLSGSECSSCDCDFIGQKTKTNVQILCQVDGICYNIVEGWCGQDERVCVVPGAN